MLESILVFKLDNYSASISAAVLDKEEIFTAIPESSFPLQKMLSTIAFLIIISYPVMPLALASHAPILIR